MGIVELVGFWRRVGALPNTGAGTRLVNRSVNLKITRRIVAPRAVFVPHPHGPPFPSVPRASGRDT